MASVCPSYCNKKSLDSVFVMEDTVILEQVYIALLTKIDIPQA